MAASERVSVDRIKEALREWRGNVSQAARAVGLSRNALMARLGRTGIDAAGFRVANVANHGNHRPISVGAIFPSRASRPTLPVMQSATVEAPPIPVLKGRQLPLRLRPDQQDLLRGAKLDLQAAYRVETDESLLLQAFFDETFDAWLASKLTGRE